MAKKKEEPPVVERRNRDAYKASFSKDYPDIDFDNDEEGAYGKMLEDRETLRSYRRSGEELNATFSKNRFIAAMLQDLAADESLDPITWMAQNGINFQEALDDPEYARKVTAAIQEYNKRQANGEVEMAQMKTNLQKSADALRSLGVDDETALQLWSSFFEIMDAAFRGEVTAETWQMLQHGMNYDADMERASQQSAMRARNEKITNKVRNYGDEEMPPTLAQGGSARQAAKTPKRGMLDDLKDAGLM